jgi:hypothetical protein
MAILRNSLGIFIFAGLLLGLYFVEQGPQQAQAQPPGKSAGVAHRLKALEGLVDELIAENEQLAADLAAVEELVTGGEFESLAADIAALEEALEGFVSRDGDTIFNLLGIIGDLVVTGSIQVGTSHEPPGAFNAGTLRFNFDDRLLQVSDGMSWRTIALDP